MPKLPEIIHEVELPKGVTVTVDHDNNENHTVVKGPKGTLERRFRYRGVSVKVDAGVVRVEKSLPRRQDMAICGTYASHIRNMVRGVTDGWHYELKAVFNHFPIKISVQGTEVVIENFLGERAARRAGIVPGVKVSAKGADVTVEGIDVQAVSQTAANIEQATRIRNKDIRVFQDGIYITKKGEA